MLLSKYVGIFNILKNCRAFRCQKGLTLVEVIVSLIVLGVIVAPVLGTYSTGFFLTSGAENISIATATGEEALEYYVATGEKIQEKEGFAVDINESLFEDSLLNRRPLRKIEVFVEWQEDNHKSNINLTTITEKIN